MFIRIKSLKNDSRRLFDYSNDPVIIPEGRTKRGTFSTFFMFEIEEEKISPMGIFCSTSQNRCSSEFRRPNVETDRTRIFSFCCMMKNNFICRVQFDKKIFVDLLVEFV